MKIKDFSQKDRRWDEFCFESDDCWFWHTSDWLNYTLEYVNKDSEIKSFYIENGNGNILAICPVIREQNDFSFNGTFGPTPALKNSLSRDLCKKLFRQMFSHVDTLAMEIGIDNCLMGISSLAKNNLKPFTYNYLMKYGFENVSLNTQVLDLDKDNATLWGEIKFQVSF